MATMSRIAMSNWWRIEMEQEIVKRLLLRCSFVVLGLTLISIIPWSSVFAAEGAGSAKSCPADMVDQGGFCIDRAPNPKMKHWYDAADICEQRGKRLCSNKEWLDACDSYPHNQIEQMPNEKSEWLDIWVFETHDNVFDAVDRGYYRCRTSSNMRPSDFPLIGRPFRCCSSK